MLKRHLLIGALAASLLAQTASADTLREALVSTYQANPTLTAQRESAEGDRRQRRHRPRRRPADRHRHVGVTRDLTRSGVSLETQGNGRTSA